MRNKFWKWAAAWFAVVQISGLVCQLAWPHISGNYAVAVWGAGLIACFPGNIFASAITEKLLWHSRISLMEMWMVSVPLMLFVNVTIWAGVLGAMRSMSGRTI